MKRNRAFYTKWTRWSPCTKFCTTTRLKSCRFPLVCGQVSTAHNTQSTTMLSLNCVQGQVTEEAYCYTTGSQCETWYKAGKSLDIGDEAAFTLGPGPARYRFLWLRASLALDTRYNM